MKEIQLKLREIWTLCPHDDESSGIYENGTNVYWDEARKKMEKIEKTKLSKGKMRLYEIQMICIEYGSCPTTIKTRPIILSLERMNRNRTVNKHQI
jgi:hypothetical protein